jgi:hypothetical protein
MVAQVERHRPAGGAEANARSAFARNVMALLERSEYRRCETGEDLEAIFRLRYTAYRQHDLVPAKSDQVVHDALDDLPNCYRFGVYVDGRLVSSIRLHDVSAKTPLSPAVTVYGDLLSPRLAAGERFIDPSRFCADPEWTRIHPQIPYITLRLAGMACVHFGAPFCVSMIREDHAAFYKRIYQSTPIGEARPYGGVINCFALLYQADVLGIMKETYARYPFFKSTPVERRLLFDRPMSGLRAPLTVLPTVRYLKSAA